DRPSTWLRVRTSFASFQEFRDLPVSAITPAIVEQYKGGRRAAGVKPVTLRHDLHALSGFFRFAVVMGWATQNPVSSVRIPSDRESVRLYALTPEDEQRYMNAAAGHVVLYANASIMLGTGVRPAEVLALRVGDIDRNKHLLIIRQGKTRAARRSIRLVGRAWEVATDLASGRNSRDWLFPSPKVPGKPWTKLTGHTAACAEVRNWSSVSTTCGTRSPLGWRQGECR
ncbi:MAG: tyrosine-type recombinase/integrase, partial [Bryobacterales bacterium]|nr:tyrosine-type recombinase/integrase [Bryobacterales bacterium]